MMIPTQRITAIVLIASMCVFLSCADLSATDCSILFYEPVAVTAVAACLINYNVGALRSDNPSKFGGILGTVCGGVTVACGGAFMHSGSDKLVLAGVVVTAIGVTCGYYGLKNLIRVQGKYLESKKLGLSIEPVILNQDRKKPEVGVQLSFTF